MAMKSHNKIKTKLQFIFREKEILNPKLTRLLCNSLVQRHFAMHAFLVLSSYPKNKKKMQVTQNKCIRFCLKLN